jgi:hypothetical protein
MRSLPSATVSILHCVVYYHFVIAVWRPKAAESRPVKYWGNHRRQAQQSRLELRLRVSRGFPTGEQSGLLARIATMAAFRCASG